jgi:GWxTD domain-containing protein
VKKYTWLWALFICLLASPIAAAAQVKKSPKDLDPRFRRWLEEEVVYIITPKEKDVFLQLENDRQRDIFIEAFWNQRDPNPTTPENEFKVEHYRRIQYANQHFGKDSPGPGWRSDMGRIYIILGEPSSIDRLENLPDVFPVTIWFYDGMIEYGLPNAFNVVFFRRDGTGPYELYSPLKYGPQYLLVNYRGDMTDYSEAYNELLQTQPTIAGISLSLIQGESLMSIQPSIASEILLNQSIPRAPTEKVKDTYAEKLLAYKDIIEVDYMDKYIDCDSMIDVLQDPSGPFYVHYLIEPKRLTFERYENRFLSNLEVNGHITDLAGNTVYQFDRKVPVEMNEGQIASIQAKLFSFQDMFPLIPGRYKLNLLFKNTVSKEFTSVEKDITIPQADSLQMSPLILANRIDRQSKYRGQNKPFLTREYQLVPSPRNDFTAADPLLVYFQLWGLTPELRENGTLQYEIFKEAESIRSLSKAVRDYGNSLNFLEEFSLANLRPANYEVRVSLLDGDKKVVLSERTFFFIGQLAALPRPWVLSLTAPPDDGPETLNILGVQHLNKKDIAGALPLLERAHRMSPQSPQPAMDYCRALLAAKEFRGIKAVALPFVQAGNPEFLQLLGQASQALGELAEAASYYKQYLNHFGANINVLNAVGDCYYQLGDFDEALVAWEKSLELNPKQDRLVSLVKELKEKK